MKQKILVNDMFHYEVIFLIGTGKELMSYFTKLKKSKKYENADKLSVIEKDLLNSPGFVQRSSLRRKNLGYNVYIVVVKTDTRQVGLLTDKKAKIKCIKNVFHHECRHLTDRIMLDRRMSFEDVETSAMIAASINVDLEETRDEWIQEEFIK